jgi:hypothetical protein
MSSFTGLKQTDVARYPQKGFWASLKPLSLLELTESTERQSLFKIWTPDKMGTLNLSNPSSREMRYLWHNAVVDLPLKVLRGITLGELMKGITPGAVMIHLQSERLFFIGPQTNDSKVQVLADWVVTAAELEKEASVIFQSGPDAPSVVASDKPTKVSKRRAGVAIYDL